MVLLIALGIPGAGQTAPSERASTPDSIATIESPVALFRKILNMSPQEQGAFLTNNYSPELRQRIMVKLREYQMLPDPLRELRLQTTELGWYLRPLLTNSPSIRAEKLKAIPEPYQTLIAARLREWDIWPPSLKEEIIEYESTMDHFVGRGAVVQPQVGVPALSPADRSDLERKLERWQAMPIGQREQMYASFEHYFRLSEEEKQKMLDTLSAPERNQTERALDPIDDKWPKAEQEKYFAALKQYLDMTPDQRKHFERSTQRWLKMSESERQAWRDMVKQLSNMPPLPPGAVLPKASGAPTSLGTNPSASPIR